MIPTTTSLIVRVGYIPAPGEAPVLDLVEDVPSTEVALQRLGITHTQIISLSYRCQALRNDNTQCPMFVRGDAPPFRCATHGGPHAPRSVYPPAPQTPKEKGRVWERNTVYQAYARVHQRTPAEQWEADYYSVGPFEAWTKRAKTQFALIHPHAISSFNGALTDTTLWFAWLNALTPADAQTWPHA